MTSHRAVIQRLESLKRAGVSLLPHKQVVQSAPTPPAEVAKPQLPKQPPAPVAEPTADISTMAAPSDRGAALAIINNEVADCTTCPELASHRTQTVFGVGNLNPRVCFLGEAPGADEDKQGEPFVGRAGQKLNDIIKACTWTRDDVYILNICKCRPPKNRTPTFQEADNCSGFLARQLEILQPEYIVCLGSCAAQNLLQTKRSVGKLRGEFHDWRGVKVVATYHPAYLLRNPDARRPVWEDMKMLLADMGIELPKKV